MYLAQPTHTSFSEVTIPLSYLFQQNHSDMWPGPRAHSYSRTDLFSSHRDTRRPLAHTHRDKTLTAWTPHSSSSAWIFSPISKTRGRIWRFALCDQVTAEEVEGPLILDCDLWLTAWLVWPCCSVSTTWAFSGTGEAGWLWNLVMQLTKLVSGPRKCYREQNPI